MRLRNLVVLPLLFMFGCSASNPHKYTRHLQPDKIIATTQPMHLPNIISWSDDFPADAGELWLEESGFRFKNPIVFLCHGSYEHVNGDIQWIIRPAPPREEQTVEALAETLHNLYPDNEIILVICNERGIDIHVPKVYYAKAKVWCIPDAYCNFTHQVGKISRYHDTVGEISDFVTVKPARSQR